MLRTRDCPCCDGHGLVSDHPRHDDDAIVECEECDASGQVTWLRYQELLAWRERCRLRSTRPDSVKRRA